MPLQKSAFKWLHEAANWHRAFRGTAVQVAKAMQDIGTNFASVGDRRGAVHAH